jgi:hypothetical protein
MKQLKHHTIPKWDDFYISKEIRGAGDKTIVFCIKDKGEELYYAPMSKEWEVYTIEMDDDIFEALDKGDYDYAIRIQDKPIRTIWKGKLTIE